MIWPTDILSTASWVLLGSVFMLLRYYLHHKWSVLKALNIPHDPPTIRNLGHARTILSGKVFTYELECKKKYGLIWGYYTLLKPRIVLHDLSMLQQVFIKEFSNFPNRAEKLKYCGIELGNGLLFIVDEQWKRVRTTITPTFSTSKLKQMIGIVERCADNTIKVFTKKIEMEDGHFVAKDAFGGLSLDVICSSAFSTDLNSQDETIKEPKISIHARRFFEVGVFNGLFLLGILFPFLESWIGKYTSRRKHVVYFRELCNKIMNERSKNLGEKNRVDLMQLMLDHKVSDSVIKNGARRGVSEIEVIGNSMTMLLAGYDTTGIAMSNLAYNLAHHQTIQKQLQLEIDEMFQSKGNLDYDSVNDLKFLDMCINENLRLYCPIARTSRVTKKEITISGLTIPPGMLIIMPINAFCHDPEYWEAPMEFKPERMRNMDNFYPMVFQPFGTGPRNCIGMRFAFMEIKVAFCKLLHEFTFETTAETPKPPLELKMDITVHPKVDYKLRVVPRHGGYAQAD